MGSDLPPMKDTGPAVAPAQVAALEQAIGAELPHDYRSFLLATNGGRTAKTHRMFRLKCEAVALNEFDSLGMEGSPLRIDGWRPTWIPKDLLPIGEASGGIVAICLRGEHAGSIWYLDTMDPRPEGSNPRVAWHDRRDFAKLASSFSAFVAGLTPLE